MNKKVPPPSPKNFAYLAGLNSNHYVVRNYQVSQEQVEAAKLQCPEDFQRGLGQAKRKRTPNDNFTTVIPTLQQTASKKAVHALIRDTFAKVWADKPDAKLRCLTLPGPLFKFEEFLLEPNSPLKDKVQEFVVMENCITPPKNNPSDPSPQELVTAKARSLRKEFPNTDFTVFKGSDYELLSSAKGRLTLRPHTGFDMVWLDWMTFWQAAQERAVNNLCLDSDNLFQRSWKQGKPALVFLTMRPQLENAQDLQVLARASQTMPQFKASSQLSNTKHADRVTGIAAFLNYQAQLRGVYFKPVVNHFYKEGQDHCLMWLSGYEVYQSSNIPQQQLTATFDTPKTRIS